MFSQSTDLYDLVYGRIKDYAAEARAVAALVRRVRPDARSILDVACGTGEHARHLVAEHGFAVDGIDREKRFLEIARGKVPQGRFEWADMRAFDLGRRYDAVLCLFSSIGYVRTLAGVRATLACFRAHLSPGGVAVVEPWFRPDQFRHGLVHVTTAEGDGITVCRMSHSTVAGRVSRIRFEYLIGRPDGLRRARESHVLGLFTEAEMRECFRTAGLDCEYDPEGPTGRGLYVGRAA